MTERAPASGGKAVSVKTCATIVAQELRTGRHQYKKKKETMSHTDFLNALAEVCETAERSPVPMYHTSLLTCCCPGYAEPGYYSPAVPIATLSCFPPSSSPSPFSSVCFSPSPAFVSTLQNGRAFQQFLDDTWPEITLRRGSAVIRNTLYEKIAETLRGGETTARFKHWVKKSEFFLIGACLAVPAVRGRLDAGKLKGAASYPHRLVAQLENFSLIIASYHNDQRGHRGIRKTYAMIQKEFGYLPRAAVGKYIELCKVCSVNRPKINKPPALDMAAGGASNESFDTGYETSDSRNSTATFDIDFSGLQVS